MTTTLPRSGMEQYHRAGIRITGEVDDPYLIAVQLPRGWTTTAPDDRGCYHVIDQHGRHRVYCTDHTDSYRMCHSHAPGIGLYVEQLATNPDMPIVLDGWATFAELVSLAQKTHTVAAEAHWRDAEDHADRICGVRASDVHASRTRMEQYAALIDRLCALVA